MDRLSLLFEEEIKDTEESLETLLYQNIAICDDKLFIGREFLPEGTRIALRKKNILRDLDKTNPGPEFLYHQGTYLIGDKRNSSSHYIHLDTVLYGFIQDQIIWESDAIHIL